MLKKLTISLGFIIAIGLIIIKVNPDFTFVGFLQRLKAFPNLKSAISSVNLPVTPQIPIPDVSGIKQVARGINNLLEGIYSMAETGLALIKVTPKLLVALLELLKFVIGV